MLYIFLKSILENPSSKKPYQDLSNYYKSIGKLDESTIYAHLIENKFKKNNVNNNNNNNK